jgi:phosphoribosylanthranilate isomerase
MNAAGDDAPRLMRMWIKICGMTTQEAVAAALEARVDAIGFVFAPSSRQVSPETASRLAEPARGRVACVAVTQHPTQEWVDEIVAAFKPDWLQTDAQDLIKLKVPSGTNVLPVMRAGNGVPQHLPARVLFEGPISGQGVAFDWTHAKAVAHRTQLVLAGGLNEGNVAAAVEAVRPFGVDVSSGVEARPGIKSPEKILRFAHAARAAWREFEENSR